MVPTKTRRAPTEAGALSWTHPPSIDQWALASCSTCSLRPSRRSQGNCAAGEAAFRSTSVLGACWGGTEFFRPPPVRLVLTVARDFSSCRRRCVRVPIPLRFPVAGSACALRYEAYSARHKNPGQAVVRKSQGSPQKFLGCAQAGRFHPPSIHILQPCDLFDGSCER